MRWLWARPTYDLTNTSAVNAHAPTPMNQGRELLRGDKPRVQAHTAGRAGARLKAQVCPFQCPSSEPLSYWAVHPYRQEFRTF